MSPEIRKLVRLLSRDGWDWEIRGTGHILLTKEGLRISCPATPSDRRSVANVKAKIKRKERAATCG